MKKFFLAAVLSIFAVAAMAQDRPTVIVSAGYQGANMHFSKDNSSNKMKSGYRAGIAVDMPVVYFGFGELSIQPGLYYSTKGYKSELLDLTSTLNLGYIDLPILANLRINLTEDMNVFVNAGPYLAYGVYSGGSLKYKGKEAISEGDKLDAMKNAFKKDGLLKPFDLGLQAGAGLEYRRIQLAVGGQLGLLNINNVTDDKDSKVSNSAFFVTLGYRF